MVECACPDELLDQRLRERNGLPSQPTARQNWYLRPGSRRPTCERLVLDSTSSVEDLTAEALRYLRGLPLSAGLDRTRDAALPPRPPLPTMRERGSEGIVPIPGPGVPPSKTRNRYENRPSPGRMETTCAPLLPHGREKGPGDEGRTSTSGLGPGNSELSP